MSYYDYEDYYNVPSEFEQQIDEFKMSLANAVKQNHKEKMDRLEKENQELQEIKKNWKDLEKEYKDKLYDLQNKINSADRDVKQKRLNEIIEDLKVVLWKANTHSVYGVKCNKCDDRREIHFTSPSGKDLKENCACANGFSKYKPVPYELYEFKQESYNSKNNISKWYKKEKSSCGDDYYFHEDGTYAELVIKTEDDFDLITEKNYYTFFGTEELCQKYCDLKNKENGITDDMVEDRYVSNSHKGK